MRYFQKSRFEIVSLGICLSAIAFYLVVSSVTYKIGFPLDDAWIHQTYARNLAVYGEWSFIPGITSGGSTSPLWTVLLSFGQLVKLPVVVWSFFLGSLALFLQATLAGKIIQHERADTRTSMITILFFILEWHYLWAALSGMETIVYSFLITAVLFTLFKTETNYLFLGLFIGLGVWIRPDSITLLGPAALAAVFLKQKNQNRFKELLLLLAGILLLLVPYGLFNISVSGSIWPNTFFAKQAEYSELSKIPFLTRYFQLLVLPLTGAGVLLLPGFFVSIYTHVRKKNIKWLGGYIWWFGINFIYALRLPVTYQHGRYLIPAMVFYFLAGILGFLKAWDWLNYKNKPYRLVSKAWVISFWVVLALFCLLGSNAYGKDVAIIETEMVNVAKWVQKNTPQESIIAVHDIGAIGYFTDRKLIDLAGLITPEIIPIIRDEEKIKNYIYAHDATYFVTFPGWYPKLSKLWDPVFVSGSHFTIEAGEENMVVYQIR